jgi:Fic family protein
MRLDMYLGLGERMMTRILGRGQVFEKLRNKNIKNIKYQNFKAGKTFKKASNINKLSNDTVSTFVDKH